MFSRRNAIKTAALGASALTLNPGILAGETSRLENPLANRKFKHSVCRWCFNDIPLEEFAERIRDLGIPAIDLLKPEEWGIVAKHGLTCSLGTAGWISLTEGFNNPANHKRFRQPYMELIEQAATMGITQVICFSGNRNGISDEAGLENCAKGLDDIVKHAEQKGITVVMELLNSKVDHKGYQCDHTPWGVALVEKIGSPNFKLLYDIYHMQIMEGDIIATIRQYKDYINHYHTAGVPGRHEINDNQELNYKAIMTAIAETGFNGYVAQEFIPTYEDRIGALREAIAICNV